MCYPSWAVGGPSLTSTLQTGPSACRLKGKLSTSWSKVWWLITAPYVHNLKKQNQNTSRHFDYTWLYFFIPICPGSAADLCKMAMIRIFNLISSSASLSARYTGGGCSHYKHFSPNKHCVLPLLLLLVVLLLSFHTSTVRKYTPALHTHASVWSYRAKTWPYNYRQELTESLMSKHIRSIQWLTSQQHFWSEFLNDGRCCRPSVQLK